MMVRKRPFRTCLQGLEEDFYFTVPFGVRDIFNFSIKRLEPVTIGTFEVIVIVYPFIEIILLFIDRFICEDVSVFPLF